MNFQWREAVEMLERTPPTLERFVSGLSAGWLQSNEGEGTWNVTEVIAHLIEAERSNWLPRVEAILQGGESRVFPPFDRFAHLNDRTDRPIGQLLETFSTLRAHNVGRLQAIVAPERDLILTGVHPAFGDVTLQELLATWVVHDLTHIAQIVRVMAERYRTDVGPWQAYLGILNGGAKRE